jgi:O-antigen/teichoic acid export membrane protein
MEASRALSLGRVTQIDVASQLAGVALMLVLAVFDRTIWILVAGSLTTSIVRTGLGHVLLPGTPNRFRWDPAAFGEILRLGKWIFVSSVLGFLANTGDRVLLGGMIDASLLGVYSIAFLLLSAVEQVLGKVIGDVAFSALSEVARDRRADLRRAVYRFHGPVAAFAYFSAGALVVAAPAIVNVLYDSRYQDAGWILQILAVALAAVPCRILAMCLLSLGRAHLHSHLVLVRLVTLFPAMLLGFHSFGLAGAVWGVVASYFSVAPLAFIYAAREGVLDVRKELLMLPALAVGAAAGFAIRLVPGAAT